MVIRKEVEQPCYTKGVKVIALVGILIAFLISNCFIYVHYSPQATTQFYNTTDTERTVKVMRYSTKSTGNRVVEYANVNEYKLEGKLKKIQYPIVFIGDALGSIYFKHAEEKKLLRDAGIRWISYALPGEGRTQAAWESVEKNREAYYNMIVEDIRHILKKENINKAAMISMGSGALHATVVASKLKEIEAMAIIAPNEGHKLNKWNVYKKIIEPYGMKLGYYIYHILGQFGWMTPHTEWYKLIENSIKEEDKTLMRSKRYEEIMNNTFIQMYGAGVKGQFMQQAYHTLENAKQHMDTKALKTKKIMVVHNPEAKEQQQYMNMMKQWKVTMDERKKETTPFVTFDQQLNDTMHYILKNTQNDYEARQTKVNEERPDTIVVGCGLAGLVAAYEAAARGARVTILEKAPRCFGNSIKASSAFNVVNSPAQLAANISDDSAELFYNDTMKAGRERNNKALVTLLTQSSLKAYTFLNETFGIKLDALNYNVSGHSMVRSLIPKVEDNERMINVGATLVFGVMNKLKTMPHVTIQNNARVTKLIQENNRVTGAQLENGQVHHAASVILATGGFSASPALLEKYAKSKAKLPTSNGPQTTGDGITLGESVGAKLVHMEAVQVQPTCIQNEKTNKTFFAPEIFREAGAIFINFKGQRFVNELLSQTNEINRAMARHGQNTSMTTKAVYMLMNDEVLQKVGKSSAFYKKAGGLQRYDTLDQLCEATTLPCRRLKKTMALYKQYAAKGVDPYRKRQFGSNLAKGPYYIVQTTPCVHYTMGGLKFNSQAQVISRTTKKAIDGLYAAGEVTGGLHGYDRFTGNALLESVVFGQIAGANAIRHQYA